MVRGKWQNLYDGGIHYGAPAHGGEVKVVTTSTLDNESKKMLRFAHLEITHMRDEGGTVRNSISIPTEQLEPLILELQKIAGLDKERDRQARIVAAVETGEFRIYPVNDKWIAEDGEDIAIGSSPQETIAEFFKIKDEQANESN